MTEPGSASVASDIIKTLIGSFAGATFAFLLAGWRIKRNERKRQIGAINRSLVVLLTFGHSCTVHSGRESL